MPDSAWNLYDGPASPELLAWPASLPEAEGIPPREWLLGTRLVRRFVSLLVAPGGVGKSALALATAVSLASGRNILDEHVHHSVPAWVLNLEDPADELNRRVAALMRLHGIGPEALHDRLFLHHGRDRRLVMAAGVDGAVTYPDQDGVLAQMRHRGIGLVVVDPFVKSHTLDENSNAHMDAAATAWAEVAEAAGAAVLLVHHVRKAGTSGPETSVDAARGAKALSDAARSATVLSPMTTDEAEQLGVGADERWRHVWLDDAKANMAPRGGKARWFRMETVTLGNGTALYPHGDQVAAIQPWRPSSPWAAHSTALLNAVLDRLAAGPSPGVLYAPTRRGRVAPGWGGRPLVQMLGVAEAQAAVMLETWLRSGVLTVVSYRDPVQRRERNGLNVVDALRPTRVADFTNEGMDDERN